VFSFTISVNDDYVIVVGDHKAKIGEDKRRKREAFVALHRMNPAFDLVQTMIFSDMEKNIISITKDPISGTLFACEYGPDILVLRYVLCDEESLMMLCLSCSVSRPSTQTIHSKGSLLRTSCSLAHCHKG